MKGAFLMAIGDIQWLQWKSKKTQNKEADEYEEWAFPYGQPQREKIEALLEELFPGEDKSVRLICFLTAKELWERVHKVIFMPEHHDYAMKCLKKDMERYKRMFRKKETRSVYCALAQADDEIDETLNYPPKEDTLLMEQRFPF